MNKRHLLKNQLKKIFKESLLLSRTKEKTRSGLDRNVFPKGREAGFANSKSRVGLSQLFNFYE